MSVFISRQLNQKAYRIIATAISRATAQDQIVGEVSQKPLKSVRVVRVNRPFIALWWIPEIALGC